MAKVEEASLLHHSRGKVGDLVIRQLYGRTVAQFRSKKTAKRSAGQKAGMMNFRYASSYAKEVLSDPWQREHYQALGLERKQPPNALLISNYLTPPTIDPVDAADYAHEPGGKIRILASDVVEVTNVPVTIRNAAKRLLETGPAA